MADDQRFKPYGEEKDFATKKKLGEIDAGLPNLPFLFSLDQISALCDLTPGQIAEVVHRRGIDYGRRPTKKLEVFRMPVPELAEWRVDYKEFRRWCRANSIPTYQW